MSTLCLCLALGGGAYAAVGGFVASDGKIRGCVSKKGQLTVLKTGKRCKRGTIAIAWNQVGQTGPAGLPGSTGQRGPQGMQGPKGDKGATGPSTGAAGGDLQGTYPNPTLKPNIVTGAKINESTLGTVPSATTAGSASNASALGGFVADAYFRSSNVTRIDHVLPQSTAGDNPATDAINGLLLTTNCNFDTGTNTQTITFKASVFGSIESQNVNPRISWQFVHDITSAEHGESAQLTSTDANLFSRPKPSGGEQGAGTFVYRDDTQTITIPFRYTVDKANNKCAVSGTATRATS